MIVVRARLKNAMPPTMGSHEADLCKKKNGEDGGRARDGHGGGTGGLSETRTERGASCSGRGRGNRKSGGVTDVDSKNNGNNGNYKTDADIREGSSGSGDGGRVNTKGESSKEKMKGQDMHE